ncbi:Plasma-membrane choline transporter family protein isoform [Arachis hypogaea]|nr:Plasma-membrane choline transporter family protein isoform [Arachis hypogaea]
MTHHRKAVQGLLWCLELFLEDYNGVIEISGITLSNDPNLRDHYGDLLEERSLLLGRKVKNKMRGPLGAVIGRYSSSDGTTPVGGIIRHNRKCSDIDVLVIFIAF